MKIWSYTVLATVMNGTLLTDVGYDCSLLRDVIISVQALSIFFKI